MNILPSKLKTATFLILAITVSSVLWIGWALQERYTRNQSINDKVAYSKQVSMQIIHLNDLLSAYLRLGIDTEKQIWLNKYFSVKSDLIFHLNQLERLDYLELDHHFLSQLTHATDALLAYELSIMKLLESEDPLSAKKALESPHYLSLEAQFRNFTQKLRIMIETYGAKHRSELESQKRSHILTHLMLIVVILVLWILLEKYRSMMEQKHFTRIIHDEKKRKEKYKDLAHFDIVTKLPNRIFFEERFDQAIARAKRYKTALALFFVDVDNFKQVNDQFGHEVGDKLLLYVANTMSRAVRSFELVARIGGDEFAIILENINSTDDAVSVAQRILQFMQENILIDEKEVKVGLSIGIAIYPHMALEKEQLKRYADEAMYQVKLRGRNGYQLYEKKL